MAKEAIIVHKTVHHPPSYGGSLPHLHIPRFHFLLILGFIKRIVLGPFLGQIKFKIFFIRMLNLTVLSNLRIPFLSYLRSISPFLFPLLLILANLKSKSQII